MEALKQICQLLDRLIIQSRLNAMAVMLQTDGKERLRKMAAALQRLPSGGYLLGAGPSTVGVIPLTVDEVVLGRAATVGEKFADAALDYEVTDTMYFVPHEVSRVHAKIVRTAENGVFKYALLDLQSTCGTYLNGEKLSPDDPPSVLEPGAVISLGPSHVSTYVFSRQDDGL